MSPYYHALKVGFNLWFILGPIMIIAMAMAGHRRYIYRDLIPRRYIKEYVYRVLAWACGIVFGLDFMIESNRGLLQFFDNLLMSGESQALPIGFAALTIMVISVGFGMLTYYVSVISGNIKYKQIEAERRRNH